jgi:ribokinase
MKPIVVVGSINMDIVSRTHRIPKPGETVIGTSFQTYSGGKGANQAVAVARLSYPCTLLGKVGNDIFGSTLLKELESYGVDISHIETANIASGTAMIAVEDSGENCIIVTPGANSEVNIEYLESKQEILKNAGIVLAQLEIPLDAIEWIAEFCNLSGIPFILDPAPAQKLPASLLARIDWFTPNESEAAFYTGKAEDIEATLDSLFHLGVRHVILKRGSRGAIVSMNSGSAESIRPFAVNARDTTAAGDAFNGAFAVALMQGNGETQSAFIASAAAAISVTKQGAQPSMAAREELDAFLEKSLAAN